MLSRAAAGTLRSTCMDALDLLMGALAKIEDDLRAELLEEWEAFGLVAVESDGPQTSSVGGDPGSDEAEDADTDPGLSEEPDTSAKPGSGFKEDAADADDGEAGQTRVLYLETWVNS